MLELLRLRCKVGRVDLGWMLGVIGVIEKINLCSLRPYLSDSISVCHILKVFLVIRLEGQHVKMEDSFNEEVLTTRIPTVWLLPLPVSALQTCATSLHHGLAGPPAGDY